MTRFTVVRQLSSIGALAVALAVAPGARAEDASSAATSASDKDASVAKLSEDGANLYKARDYRHAVEKFIQAYALDPDPNLLFNIARCYDFMGDTDAAIEKYEAFVRAPGVDAQGRQRAQAALRNLRQSKNAPPAAEPPAQSAPAETQPAGAGTHPALDDAATAGSGSPGVWPWVSLGAGVAITTFGATMYLLGAHDHENVTSSPGYGDSQAVDPMTQAAAKDLVDSGTMKKTIGGIGLGVGGALIATSLVLFLSNSSADTTSDRSLGIALAPTHGGGAFALHGRF